TPFYADNRSSLSTWYGDSWRRGGGTVWGYFTADLERNAFYYSTGNCGPWNPDYRREWGVVTLDENGGLVDYRNNWCASQMARDATTGHLIWAFNMTPADPWDLDEPLITPLITMEDGRDVAIKAARNGYFFVWDRDTGELVREPWAFVYIDNNLGYDMETGRAMYDIDTWLFTNVEDRRRYTDADPGTRADGTQVADYTGTEVEWCPSIAARNWQNDAYSPRTGLVYTSTLLNCRTQVVFEGEYIPGEGYTLQRQAGAVPRQPRNADGTVPAPGTVPPADRRAEGVAAPHQGELQANSPEEGRTVWRFITMEANNMPIMATATDLLFQGGVDAGVMRALNATNGEVVWEFRTGSRFNQSPITYLGPDGKQYMAIIASSAAANGAVAFDAAADNANRYRRSGSTLYVFALPDAVAGN
ncbi:MAG: PQQ-binding-like beta-propeller repeat protein, partial [Bauldia sp.]|nr:PQQ-binding-like beta-propeller repeat protein [Bauldia sp.]